MGGQVSGGVIVHAPPDVVFAILTDPRGALAHRRVSLGSGR